MDARLQDAKLFVDRASARLRHGTLSTEFSLDTDTPMPFLMASINLRNIDASWLATRLDIDPVLEGRMDLLGEATAAGGGREELEPGAAVLAGAVFVLLLLYCVIWPAVSPYDPNDVDFSQARQMPSLEHPFGTDTFGRDLFTRTALGGRISIGIGFAATLVMVDRVIARLRRALPARGALVITADHGHVAVDPEQKVDLGALRLLLSGMSGSGRLRYLHARAGAVRELLPAARELVGARAWVFDRDTLLSTGWLGPQPTPLVASRVGDVVLAARGAATMVDPSEGRINSLVTVHGSVTADEMLVPLLAARGEAGR